MASMVGVAQAQSQELQSGLGMSAGAQALGCLWLPSQGTGRELGGYHRSQVVRQGLGLLLSL